MKLSGKILAFVVSIVVLSVLSITFVVMAEDAAFQNESTKQSVVSNVNDLNNEVSKFADRAKEYATLLGQNQNVIEGVKTNNFFSLQASLDDLNSVLGLSTISVTDAKGNVIIRQHKPDEKGDNISDQTNVQHALKGEVSSTLEEGALVSLSSRAGAPVIDHGVVIGSVIVGFTFEKLTILEDYKANYGMEFSIFSGSKRLVTTIHDNGSAVVGTEMDPKVQAAVLQNGQTYSDDITLFGRPYIAAYMPIINTDGKIIGSIAGAMSLEKAEAAVLKTALFAGIGCIVVIAVSVLVLSLFVRRSIRKPMLSLVDASRALAEGKLDVKIDVQKRKDEIGILGNAILQVVEKISGLIADIALQEGRVAEGHLLERTDESAYSGEYKALIQGYNKTVDTLVNYMNKLPLPVLVLDREFTMCYINENGAELLESTQQELLGRKCHDMFRTDDCQSGRCVCLKAMNSGQQEVGETTAHLESGSVLEIRYMGIPIIKNGEVVGALEAITDLTAIKEAQRESERQNEALNELLTKIEDAAGLVESGSRQVSEGSQVLSQGATEQAATIQELSSSITEIAQQTQVNAQNSEKASAVADATRGGTKVIDEKMGQMLEAMNEISAASANISKIIKAIDDIAFQTNILALNAAVEAARAGVHGKGFAVVADEVRSLAARSAVAAKETAQLIETSLGTVAQGTKVAADTAQTLEVVVKGIEESAALMDEVAAASKQQSLGISQVERGIEQVAIVIQNITATAEESAAASEELSSQSVILTELVREHDEGQLRGTETNSLREAGGNHRGILLGDDDFGKY